MKGYQIYKRVSELIDDYDPDERRVEREYAVSPLYLDEKQCKEEFEKMRNIKDDYDGNPISYFSKTLDYFIRTIEIEGKKIWHRIDEVPEFEMKQTDDMRFYMSSDLIITSNYGHISREAHYYTPESWNNHVDFELGRQMKWAYEKDLINL